MSKFFKFAAMFAIIIAAVCLWTNITQGSGTCNVLSDIGDFFSSILCSIVQLIVWLLWMLATITVSIISGIFGITIDPIKQPDITC